MDINEPDEQHEVFDLPTAKDLEGTEEAQRDADMNRPYIPRGQVPGVLQEIEVTESKAGKQMTVWTFAVATGYAKGREIKSYIILEQPFRLRKMVDAVGLEAEEGGGIAYGNPKHQGSKCLLVIGDNRNGQTDSNGNAFAELKNVLASKGDEGISI